jgi:uncharacterized protein (DUF927 family)
MESGGFNLFGPSSKGKTTCAQVAGSVWGGPSFSETWRATANGLEAICLAHNDALLVLDEQGQADPRECSEIVYMVGNGIDKVRATKTLENRQRRRWRVTYISTGEVTLADKLREIGLKTKAGQAVRLVDIPVCPDGLSQAFEEFHGMGSSKDMANHLKVATSKYYGTPIREFLKRIALLDLTNLTLNIRERMRQWVTENVPPGSDAQVGRVADRFALAAVAGELASAWRIVPWYPREADRAATTCFRAWLTHRGGIHSSEQQEGIRSVLDFIDRHGQSRFQDRKLPDQRVVQMAGWRETLKGQHPEIEYVNYLFTPVGWQEACEGFNPKDVARAMLKEGLLDAHHQAGGGKAQKKVRIGPSPMWLYFVPGSAIAAFREREVQRADLFPHVREPEAEGEQRIRNSFFDSLWMFPRSLRSPENLAREALSCEEAAVILGGRVSDTADVDEVVSGGEPEAACT